MNDRQGYTLVELILVLFLLVLIAFAVFSLTSVGSQAYLRLTTQQEAQSDLRIGLSYLDVKLRQNDAQGAISVRPFPYAEATGNEALLIERRYDDRVLNLWIYEHDGYLCELLVEPEAMATADMGSRIAAVQGSRFEVLSSQEVKITLRRQVDETYQERSRTITLKSGGIR